MQLFQWVSIFSGGKIIERRINRYKQSRVTHALQHVAVATLDVSNSMYLYEIHYTYSSKNQLLPAASRARPMPILALENINNIKYLRWLLYVLLYIWTCFVLYSFQKELYKNYIRVGKNPKHH